MLMRRPHGFTLVELMVVVAIFALLLTLVVPIMAGFIASSKIRTAAESYATGLTHARAESIKQNTNVEMLVSTGKWEVRRLSDSTVLQQAAGKEGSTDIVLTVTPNGATRIAFDSFGRIVATSPVDASSAITQLDFDVSNGAALGTSRRRLRVLVQTGGAVKVCDPLAASTDPRACV
jgi:type IV fimbrial biogenesis protein FimT